MPTLNHIAIGLGAGAASALLYFAVTSGTVLAFVLFYVAPLPVLVAGLGWGTTTGLIAALSGALLAAIATVPLFGLAFFVGCSAPAAWLARLALLGRPVDPAEPSSPIEWYPIGRLVLWAAGLGTVIILVAVTVVGGGLEDFRASIEDAVRRMIADGTAAQIGLPEDVDPDTLAEVLGVVLPPISAAVWTLTMVLNLWLAARIVAASGNSLRPLPDIGAINYPSAAGLALGGLIVLSFLPGLPGLVGTIGSASLTIAYLILGLAVIHVITRGAAGRAFLLAALYATLFVLAWTIPLLAALGLGESFLRLRERVQARTGRGS